MITRILTTCILAGGLAAASAAYADDTQTKSSETAIAANGQNNKAGKRRIDSQIDRLSTKVDLTSDQKDQLRSQLAKSNQNTQKLWQQFANAHVQVIKLEAEMTAALEDVLAPEQKAKTQQNRQAKADSESSRPQAGNKSDNSSAAKSAKSPVKDGSGSTGSDNASTRSGDGKSNMKKSRDPAKTSKPQRSAKNDDSENQNETEEYVWTMVIVPAQQELSPLGLSAEQEQQADRIFYSYHNKIVKGWQKIDQLHDQLVAKEAQSILDVESVLTKDQRQKLMDMRKKSTSDKKDGSKSKNKD